MKTKQEIKEEIIELYGATQALGDAMNILHAQRMEKSKQMMALNHMLREMGDEPEGAQHMSYAGDLAQGLVDELLAVIYKYEETMVLPTVLGCLEIVKHQILIDHTEEADEQ